MDPDDNSRSRGIITSLSHGTGLGQGRKGQNQKSACAEHLGRVENDRDFDYFYTNFYQEAYCNPSLERILRDCATGYNIAPLQLCVGIAHSTHTSTQIF